MCEPTLDRGAIVGLLDDLSRRAAARGARVDLFLVGGGAMVLVYNATRTTKDIEGIFEPKMLAYELAADIAKERGLPPDWLNDAVKVFPFPLGQEDAAAKTFYEGAGLAVRVASPRYLFLMKAWSGREADEDDLRVLWPLCHYANADECLDEIEAAYPSATLRPRTRYIVEAIAQADEKGELADRDGASHMAGRAIWVAAHMRNGRPVKGHRRPLPGSSQ